MTYEPIIIFICVVLGLLLFWRVAVASGLIPWRAAFQLYRNSVAVLRRNWWIVVIDVIGLAAGLVVTQTRETLATRAGEQHAMLPERMAGQPGPWQACLQRAGTWTLRNWNALVWRDAVGGLGLWLPAILLIVCRHRIVPQLLPADNLQSRTRKWLQLLLWISVAASLAVVVFSLILPTGLGAGPQGNAWAWLLTGGILLSGLVSVFNLIVVTYLENGLFAAARTAKVTASSHASQLLEVTSRDFWRLLKFNTFLTIVFSLLPMLAHSLMQWGILSTWADPTSRPMNVLESMTGYALPILQIVLFPALPMIIFDQTDWRTALRRTPAFWRKYAGDWLALLLPLLLVAFMISFTKNFAHWYARAWAVPIALPNAGLQLLTALVSAVWLITIVGWWTTARQVSPQSPPTVSGA